MIELRQYTNVEAELDLVSLVAHKPDIVFTQDAQVRPDMLADKNASNMLAFVLDQYAQGNTIVRPSLYSDSQDRQQEFQTVLDRRVPLELYSGLVRTISELHALRCLRSLADSVVTEADYGSQTSDQLIETFGSGLAGIQLSQGQSETGGLDTALNDFHSAVLRAKDAWDACQEIPVHGPITGTSLDRCVVGGLESNDLEVVAAYTSIGKTQWTVQFAIVNLERGMSVAMFSLEMSKQQLFYRMMSHLSGVSSTALKTGEGLNPQAMARISQALDRMKAWKLYVNDTCSQSTKLSEILAKSKRLKFMDKRLGLIVIDYLTLIQNDIDKYANNADQVGAVVKALKRLAGQIQTPIVLVSQLSRDLEKDDRPPELSDLRSSGDIEQGADVVLFLHTTKADRASPRARTRVFIAKNRNGPLGEIWTENDKISQSFREVKAIVT